MDLPGSKGWPSGVRGQGSWDTRDVIKEGFYRAGRVVKQRVVCRPGYAEGEYWRLGNFFWLHPVRDLKSIQHIVLINLVNTFLVYSWDNSSNQDSLNLDL